MLVKQEHHAYLDHLKYKMGDTTATLNWDECKFLFSLIQREPFSVPKVGTAIKCLVCAYEKPYAIFDTSTGAAVCQECRERASAPPAANVAHDCAWRKATMAYRDVVDGLLNEVRAALPGAAERAK